MTRMSDPLVSTAWLAEHEFWGPVIDGMKELHEANVTVYIITTKAKDFTLEILKFVELDKIVPEQRVYGLGSGEKHQVIEAIFESLLATEKKAAFVEDRVETLVKADEYFRQK